ncbi:FeoB-associated Cys-rich membrane protein [Flavobacterium sp.]|nr:FeoB-associated Cys-rich membrane protein [Flavobacterium sp.]
MIPFQEIIVYLLLGFSVAFLWKKFFGNKKKKNKQCGGDSGCGCS